MTIMLEMHLRDGHQTSRHGMTTMGDKRRSHAVTHSRLKRHRGSHKAGGVPQIQDACRSACLMVIVVRNRTGRWCRAPAAKNSWVLWRLAKAGSILLQGTGWVRVCRAADSGRQSRVGPALGLRRRHPVPKLRASDRPAFKPSTDASGRNHQLPLRGEVRMGHGSTQHVYKSKNRSLRSAIAAACSRQSPKEPPLLHTGG